MPDLREALSADGFDDVRTYVQSGNIVLRSDESPEALARRVAKLIARGFDLEIAVVVRTRDELAEVVACNPLGKVAVNPKRYQVSFLDREPDPEVVERLKGLVAGGERLAVVGREIYGWHPEGVGRSKLWGRLAGTGLGVTATARNWTTVTTLLEMADELGGQG